MKWCALISCLLFVSCGGGSSSDDVAEAPRCEQLRDHLVEMQLVTVDPATGVDRAAHRKAMKQALGEDFIASCNAKLTDSQVDCALAAMDPSVAAACSNPTNENP